MLSAVKKKYKLQTHKINISRTLLRSPCGCTGTTLIYLVVSRMQSTGKEFFLIS